MSDDQLRRRVRAQIHELVPTLNRVMVEPIDAEEVTEGGLIIPEVGKKPPTLGRVIKTGPGNYNMQHDKFVPVPVKPGDIVIFGDYAGHTIEAGGKTLKLLNESDVFGIIPAVYVSDLEEEDGLH